MKKNLDFLIDEYKNFELPQLNIIGMGTYSDRLQNEINQNNLNINYIGHVPNEELPKYYNKFKFFILLAFASIEFSINSLTAPLGLFDGVGLRS